jgi:hypothetical protein
LRETGGRWLVAYAVKDGAEVLRTRLPDKDFDPLPVPEVAGCFLVQLHDPPGGNGKAWLIDRKGEVRYRLDHQIVILLTSRQVVRLARDGTTLWSVRFSHKGMARWRRAGGA